MANKSLSAFHSQQDIIQTNDMAYTTHPYMYYLASMT